MSIHRMIYAVESGMYYSDNGGTTQNPSNVLGIIFTKVLKNSGTYYACGGSGLYSSINGATWTLVKQFTATVYTIFIDGSTFYIGTSNGVYISTDLVTFNHTYDITEGNPVRAFAKLGSRIWAAGHTMIIYSDDNGATWNDGTTLSIGGLTIEVLVDGLFSDGTTLFLGNSITFTAGGGESLWYRTNVTNWTPNSQAQFGADYEYTVNTITKAGSTYFLGGIGASPYLLLMRSTDGMTWTDISSGAAIPGGGGILGFYNDTDGKFYACGDSARVIYTTNNGNAWTQTIGHTFPCLSLSSQDNARAVFIQATPDRSYRSKKRVTSFATT